MPSYLVVFCITHELNSAQKITKVPCVASAAADAKADRPRKGKTLEKKNKNEKEEIKSAETTTKSSMAGWKKIFMTFL